MPIIDLEQGSQKWLSYRQGKVMATDSSILMGTNHWKTPLNLWEEKLGILEPDAQNESMKRGQRLEPEARELAIKEIDIEFSPCVFESERYPFMAASLDGVSHCFKYILEIKCPSKDEKHLDAISGVIPFYYIDQIQHQLLVTGCECAFYFSYRPEYKEKPFAVIQVFSDLDRQYQIFQKAQEFYTQMCTMQPPEILKLVMK